MQVELKTKKILKVLNQRFLMIFTILRLGSIWKLTPRASMRDQDLKKEKNKESEEKKILSLC